MPIIVPEKTIKIQAKGLARLSPDLAALVDNKYCGGLHGRVLSMRVYKKRKRVTLDATPGNGVLLGMWMVGARATSGMIFAKTILRELGINAKDVVGKVYKVRVRGKKIFVQF